jgi:transposase-like protein
MSEPAPNWTTEAPTCPHCGLQVAATNDLEFDSLNVARHECAGCHETFGIERDQPTLYTSYRIA